MGKRGRAGAGWQVLASEVVQRWMRARETAPDSTAGRQSRRGATTQLGVMRWGTSGEQSKKGAAPAQIWSRAEKTAGRGPRGSCLRGQRQQQRQRGPAAHVGTRSCNAASICADARTCRARSARRYAAVLGVYCLLGLSEFMRVRICDIACHCVYVHAEDVVCKCLRAWGPVCVGERGAGWGRCVGGREEQASLGAGVWGGGRRRREVYSNQTIIEVDAGRNRAKLAWRRKGGRFMESRRSELSIR
jgi:hypothetical protein